MNIMYIVDSAYDDDEHSLDTTYSAIFEKTNEEEKSPHYSLADC